IYEPKLFPEKLDVDKKNWAPPGERIRIKGEGFRQMLVSGPEGAVDLASIHGGTQYSFKAQAQGLYTVASVDKHGNRQETAIEIASRDEKYSRALDRIINWYPESGVMPKADGSRGVYEGFRSTDHKLIPIYRSDCNTETAMAMYLYGRLHNDKSYRDISANILGFLFDAGWQDMNEKRATYGLWKFYDDLEVYPRTIWCNDNSWAAETLLALHRYEGDKDYLKRGMATCESFYRLGMEKRICISGGELNQKGLEVFLEDHDCINTPHCYVPILYLHAYKAGGESKYLERAESGSVACGQRCGEACHHSDIFAIYLLAALYKITGKEEYRARLNATVRKVKKYQLPCGAVRNFLNNEKHTRERYGLLEVGVMHRMKDNIADLLYINAPLVYSMYTAYKLTGDEEYGDIFRGIMDFMVRIQIESSDKRLNGAWMRAFDYDRWDYYGSNGDVDWGPYCVESGWTNSWIAKTLALYLLNETDI
ncbi:MAG: hypothetical protein PHT33_15190, partial [bacterium]|nr:hypothetical protein [bacterium]